jgi:hypothetical protein
LQRVKGCLEASEVDFRLFIRLRKSMQEFLGLIIMHISRTHIKLLRRTSEANALQIEAPSVLIKATIYPAVKKEASCKLTLTAPSPTHLLKGSLLILPASHALLST